MSIIGIIAARWASTRFPGKPLADIHGKPMIWHVWNAAKQARLDEVYVATDDDRIGAECDRLGIKWVMTSSKPRNSTERVAEAAKELPADYYVDIQGDEPMVKADAINTVIEHQYYCRVVNLYARITAPAEILDPNTIKVVADSKGWGIYLSRQPIPFPRERDEAVYHKQVCVYGFTADSLRDYAAYGETLLERVEGIHILRCMDMGVPVMFRVVDGSSLSVDTPSDLERVRAAMAAVK